jgi:uncharacterized membrane protein
MKTVPNKKTRSARRKLVLALVFALLGLGLGAYAVFAAGGKDFSIAASPANQTVSQGQAATYTVTVTRVNGFTGSVTLSATNLPSGASASWKLSDGTSSNVVPPNLNSATLTIQTASNTPNGTSQPQITATSGKLTDKATVTLIVQPASQPNFALSVSPVSQTVLQGDETTYSVSVNRSGGFSGPVALSVSGLPKKATASWVPGSTVPGGSSGATLQIDAARDVKTDNYTLTVTGNATVSGNSVPRSAAVTLVVEETKNFQVAGDLGAPLAPGVKSPLNLSLTNPYDFTLRVTNLAVAVEEGTSRAGCSGTQNFKVTAIPAARYPIMVPKRQTRTLAQLGLSDSDQPQVEMLNQPWNQDACKGVTITLDYGGSARK